MNERKWKVRHVLVGSFIIEDVDGQNLLWFNENPLPLANYDVARYVPETKVMLEEVSFKEATLCCARWLINYYGPK